MNYLKVYCNLIRKSENRTPPNGYTEKHHIFPKSIFGKNNRTVILTAREHYIAHALLEKICIRRYGLKAQKTIKMTYAHCMMRLKSKNRQESYYNSYLYECAKIRKSKVNHSKGKKHTEETKNKISKKVAGKNHPLYGKTHSTETRNKISRTIRLKRSNYRSGFKLTEEHKRKLSQRRKGVNPWNKGKTNIYSQKTLERMKKSQLKYNWTIMDKNGKIYLIDNMTQFCKENHLHLYCMNEVFKGNQKQHKGWIVLKKELLLKL